MSEHYFIFFILSSEFKIIPCLQQHTTNCPMYFSCGRSKLREVLGMNKKYKSLTRTERENVTNYFGTSAWRGRASVLRAGFACVY